MTHLSRLILLIIAILVFSCSGNRYPKELLLADSLLEHKTKQAIALLDSLEPKMQNAGKAVRNYYSLLRIKADDKTYVKHTSDTLILRLVDYYEHGGDKTLLPTAYYYAGSTYIDLNNYPEALKYFQNVLDVTPNDDYLKYKAYSQMGYVFLYQDLYDKGIEAFANAYNYNKKVGNKNNQIYELCGIAYCYQRENKDDIALKYFKQALILSREVGRNDLEQEIVAQIANHYYKQKEYVKAKTYIQQIQTKRIEGKSELSINSIMADIYDKTGQRDSALFLYKKIYAVDNIYAKHFASKRLGYYYLRTNSPMSLPLFLEYETFSDSIQDITQTQAVAKVNALYNYQIKEKENKELKTEIKEKRYVIFIISLFVVVVILSLLSYIMYIRRKRQEEHIKSSNLERLMREQFERSRTYIEDNLRRIAELKTLVDDLQDRGNESASKIRLEEEKLINMNKLAEIKIANKKLAKEGIEASDIYNKIRDLYDSRIPDDEKKMYSDDWTALDDEVNKHFPNFKNFLLDTCKISEIEYRICLLIKIGIPPVGIATFTNRTKSAVSLVRKRLYTKVFDKEDSPSAWDDFIHSL